MAIWQLSFDVVDKNKDLNDEDIRCWEQEPEKVRDIAFLDKIKDWSKDIETYGDLEKTCIELCKENDKATKISIRLDVRGISETLLEDIINYIVGVDGKILYKNELFAPSLPELKGIIIKSDAFRFCTNVRRR
ncbi:MAG: hypothetical protein J5802_08555 [Butyrivibrio sp.]|nr:hypothetical protein [Butyrivibrio sp.]